jgi:hypothetical protein
MPVFKVCLTGHFSQELDVFVEPDADGVLDDSEIEAQAISLFESDYAVSGPSWSEGWDYVGIDSLEEVE